MKECKPLKLGAVFGTFIGGALMLDVGRKRLGQEEIARHIVDTDKVVRDCVTLQSDTLCLG